MESDRLLRGLQPVNLGSEGFLRKILHNNFKTRPRFLFGWSCSSLIQPANVHGIRRIQTSANGDKAAARCRIAGIATVRAVLQSAQVDEVCGAGGENIKVPRIQALKLIRVKTPNAQWLCENLGRTDVLTADSTACCDFE